MRITRSPIEAVTVAVSTLASPNEFAGQPNAEPDFIMLAERFVAALSGDPHPSSAAILRTENDCGRGISELLQDLGEDSDAEADPEPDWKPEQQTHLSVDLVVAATRLAAMFATLPLALKAIQEHAPIVVIETGDAAINKPVCYVMTKALLGERVTILSPGRFDRMTTPYFTDPTAVVFEGEPGLKAHDMQARDKRAIAAIQSGAIIIGVAMDSRRELAADLVRAADYRVNLPPLNADGLRFAIGVLAGARPSTSIDALISRETTIPDLRIALRGCCSADLAVERLITIVGKRLALVNKAVRVEDLDG